MKRFKEKLNSRDDGFTLIEIVLVLALAALIMIMVFIALSGAEKSRRDTERKNQLGQISSQLEQYASNNNGTYPNSAATLSSFTSGYLTPTSSYEDPLSNSVYSPSYTAFTTGTLSAGTVDYHDGYICNGSYMTTTGATANNYAIVMGLESGAPACRSNN